MVLAPIDGYGFEKAIDYHYGAFPPKKLDYERLVKPLAQATAAIARYDALLRGLHNKDLLLAPLRRQEAVVSSRIEGTVATLDEVLKLEAETDENEDDAGNYRQEVIEVYSYSRALLHAQKLMADGLPICSRLIRETHGRLLFLGRGADKQPGTFKTDQNYVVDRGKKQILFVPIKAEQLEVGIASLENFINSDEIEPLIQTAIAHAEFEALHPFKDGNGRVGRMLITLSLWNKGLISGPFFYVSGHIETQKDEYVERLRMVSSEDAWTDWCVFFLTAVEAQANDCILIAEKIISLYEEMKEVFRKTLASQWTMTALDYIFGNPVFKNSAFTSRAGIPKQTANRFTNVLSDKGLLTVVQPAAGRRAATYAFEPLMKIVRS